ncbi:MAG: cupin domain-containing protein [Gaiellaceae bacterium]
MSDQYFAADASAHSEEKGTWVKWDTLEPFEMVPGLTFQPVIGDKVMANFVSFEPHTEAPVHWHDEEQITYVMDGEFEFEVAGEVRTMRRGDAVVIPPNVPHGARTHDTSCLEIDVFHPPRRGLLEALGRR